MSAPITDLESRLVDLIESEALCPAEIDHSTDWLGPCPVGINWFGGGNLIDETCSNAPRVTKLRTVKQLMAEPLLQYVVRGLVPSRGLIAVFGPPGSGKSFLVMDLVFAIAGGHARWFGRRLVQKPIAYVALEGQGGISIRIRAWQAEAGAPAPSLARFQTANLSLLEAQDAEELGRSIVSELGDGAVTVIDTLSRASAGGDENSSTDMTKVIRNAELLGSIVGGPVILVHHTGKNADKGMRGHSSLLGAVDTAVEIVHSAGIRSWKVTKAKDGEAGGEHSFELVPHCVDTDQWGDHVTSCAIRQLLGPVVRAVAAPTGRNQIAGLAALRRALSEMPEGVSWKQAVGIAAAHLVEVAAGRRNAAAKAALEALLQKGNISLKEGYISLA